MVVYGTLGKEVTMFQIDSLSDKPIYKQIVDQIKSMISKNLLQEGDKLPSVREFSKMLGEVLLLQIILIILFQIMNS